MNTVAQRIEALLVAQSRSARELSQRAGLGSNHVATFLRHARQGEPANLDLGTLAALARGLGVSTTWLATGETPPPEPEARLPRPTPSPSGWLSFTTEDLAALRQTANAHLVCNRCGRLDAQEHPVICRNVGSIHYRACGGHLVVHPEDIPHAVDTSLGPVVVRSLPEGKEIGVRLLLPEAVEVRLSREPQREPVLLARLAALEAAREDDRAYHETVTHALTGLLRSLTRAVVDRDGALGAVELVDVRAYLLERGWTRVGRHPSGVAETWRRHHLVESVELVLADREAGDYRSRLWDMTLETLALVEERSQAVILAHLLHRGAQRRALSTPTTPPNQDLP